MKRAIAYFAVLLIATLVALEALVRATGMADPLFTEPAFETAPGGTYWRYRPGFDGWVAGPTHVRIGAHGARLHAPADAPPARVRVAVFGDSVAFGLAVEDSKTFSAQLQAALRQSRHEIDVLNFGVQEHTIEMALDHLADRLPEVQPQVVVLAFVTDAFNAQREHSGVDHFGYLTDATSDESSFRDVLRAGLRHSHLALMSEDVWRRWHTTPADGASLAADAAGLEPALQRFEAALARFDQLTAQRGRVVLCLNLRQSPLTRAMHDRVRQRFPQLPYFDASPTLDPAPLDGLRILPDGHPNARAHLIYTRMLSRPVLRELSAVLPGYLENDQADRDSPTP